MIKQCLSLLLAAALVALPLPTQAKEGKDQDRLENCGMVLAEILNIPDDIPSNLLNKAECVIVIPSVLKLAVGFSGSYGRGAMTCRTGEHYTGPWSAPSMMRLEGGGFGLQLGVCPASANNRVNYSFDERHHVRLVGGSLTQDAAHGGLEDWLRQVRRPIGTCDRWCRHGLGVLSSEDCSRR